MQSLVKGDEVKDLVRDYGMVIVDECHHVPAFSFEQILRKVAGRYVYGLTATPVRQDGHHPIIFMQCGPVRYRVDARKHAEERPFDHFIIPRFTPFRKPLTQDENDWHITEIYRELSQHNLRNELIVNDVVCSVAEGRNPLVLTERTAHVETLANALRKSLSNVITLTGSMSTKARKDALVTLTEIPADQNFVLVATGKFIGEGFDEPRLNTLFLAMPVAWKGTVQQYTGRLHRLCDTKKEVLIYDYVDIHVGVLERMYHKRLKGYASIGYTAKSDSKTFESQNVIFDNTNFLTVFHNDLAAAKNEIIIVSPFLGKNRVKQMLSALLPAMCKGVKVTVVTRPESDHKEKDRLSVRKLAGTLENAGIHLVFRSGIHQKFAILYQRIVWYGSINLLSFGRSEGSIMRLDSLNIANELTCSIKA
ncbi:MAG: putative DNA repair helicase RadD [Dehalococcoidia bacterium]|nr:putative DNA repair helicase RadD [Bacillota bacterium]MBT9143634.1 putative DNA repair helicase RadD [Bacillota bacterium]